MVTKIFLHFKLYIITSGHSKEIYIIQIVDQAGEKHHEKVVYCDNTQIAMLTE